LINKFLAALTSKFFEEIEKSKGVFSLFLSADPFLEFARKNSFENLGMHSLPSTRLYKTESFCC
jgi:hypothetical protein